MQPVGDLFDVVSADKGSVETGQAVVKVLDTNHDRFVGPEAGNVFLGQREAQQNPSIAIEPETKCGHCSFPLGGVRIW
jgi:hypothetical protein